MAKPHLAPQLNIIFIIFTITVSDGPPLQPSLSAYGVLQQFSFPVGLLPKGVTKYELNNFTGEFKAYLGRTCSFALRGSYELRYKPVITGQISKGKLSKLQGMSVKVVLLWVNIVELRRDGDELEFSVGITSANFPIIDFDECPRCRCGFDCGDGDENKIEVGQFVYSS